MTFNEKCSFLVTPRGIFCKTLSWAGCQNNSIYVSFNLQKSLKSFDKNSADKIQSKKNYGGVE
jgi:hypothetical protein